MTKKESEITIAEWILYEWVDVTPRSVGEREFIRSYQRPLDEAMVLAGGTMKDLQPYLWALKQDEQPPR